MQRWMLVTGALWLAGCEQEFSISDNSGAYGVDNPQELATPRNTDRVVQLTTPEVDVLFAIDNSCSMEDEQLALTDAFPYFMTFFLGSGLDYHVGVVSTDMDDPSQSGKLREAFGARWIDNETPSPVETFEAMAFMGISGSGEEQGRESVYTALALLDRQYNKGYIREGAGLHVVLISDEQDDSGNDVIGKREFAEWLLDTQTNDDNVTFSSIVVTDDLDLGGLVADEEVGADYLWITNKVGGIEWDIRSDRWDLVLEQLGVQASGLKREFFLSELPVEDTIQVAVRERQVEYAFEEGTDWTYDANRNSVQFVEYIPPALSEVLITYDVLAALQDDG